MANQMSVSITGQNTTAYPAAKVMGFPSQGVLIEAVTFPATLPNGVANPFASCVTQLTLLATGTRYYSVTATATVITAANA